MPFSLHDVPLKRHRQLSVFLTNVENYDENIAPRLVVIVCGSYVLSSVSNTGPGRHNVLKSIESTAGEDNRAGLGLIPAHHLKWVH